MSILLSVHRYSKKQCCNEHDKCDGLHWVGIVVFSNYCVGAVDGAGESTYDKCKNGTKQKGY